MRFILLVFCTVSALQGVYAKPANYSHNVNSKSVAAAWFAGWHENQFPPEEVPWKGYTHVIYSFAYVEFPVVFACTSLMLCYHFEQSYDT